MKWRQSGSSFGEQLIMLAMMALVITMVAVAFSRSMAYGLAVVGIGLGTAMLVFVYGIVREWRMAHRREQRIRTEMERAAAQQQAALELTFFGEAQAGQAAFGVSSAARKLIHARDGFQKVAVTVLDFDQLGAAFARPERDHFRLEVRTRAGEGGSPRESFHVLVPKRDDAERWVRALAPHLGERARFLTEPTKDEPKPRG